VEQLGLNFEQYDIVVHRDRQTSHVIKRFRERFNIRADYALLNHFHDQIMSGNARMMKDLVLAKVYEVEHKTQRKNLKIWLVFDHMTNQIATVLDPGSHKIGHLKLDHPCFQEIA